jgi:hypothetical protein
MPKIMNGQYADIVLLSTHLSQDKDVILRDKYYRYHGNSVTPYVRYKGIDYLLRRSERGDVFYESTGVTFGNETLPYQEENRRSPLVYQDGVWEIRAVDKGVVSIDGRAGWINEARMESDAQVIYKMKTIIPNSIRVKVKQILKQMNK